MEENQGIGEHVDKLEVLSDIYIDMTKKPYKTKEERDVAKLKMELIKKEMLLITYLINKDIDKLAE